jgi:aspartate/methionine/tyrosine aminotransferase
MRQVFDRRRRLLYTLLNEIPGVSCVEPEGAFYTFPSVAGVLGCSIRGRRPTSSLELAAILLDEARVAVVPGEAFGAAGFARLSYALADDQLAEGARRMAELLGEAKP